MTGTHTARPSELNAVAAVAGSPVRLQDTTNILAKNIQDDVDIKTLRDAIPQHCFRPSATWSAYFILRDLALAISLATLACIYLDALDNRLIRYSAWAVYGCIQGFIFTGIWVLGHECGHGSLFPQQVMNDTVGFLLHSGLLTPYFSWKFTHRRHHIYANNMVKDLHYVPPRREAYLQSFWHHVEDLDELVEDTPLITLMRLLLAQTLGWPLYLLTNITASPGSSPRQPSSTSLGNSHLAPFGSLFRIEDAFYVLLSDLGILFTLLILRAGSCQHARGLQIIILAYVQPYLWLNHWIVAITYLHHNDPDVPKYEPESWTFIKGATATVDRNLGWVGTNLMHGIAEFHVIHHLFSTIPFYHAEEATRAIIPLLRGSYHVKKQQSFLHSLWENFTKCQYVEPQDEGSQSGVLWFRPGPIPGPEYSLGRKLW